MRVAFIKLVWEDLPSQNTPINAENLNRLEQAIEDLCYMTNDLSDRIDHVKAGIEVTQAEYDALTPEEKMNGTTYYITDAEGGSLIAASDAMYDNDESGLSATNVQSAIDEVSSHGPLVIPDVPVVVATNGNIIDYDDERIKGDHYLVRCVFANPSAITNIVSDPGLVVTDGNMTLGGTCTTATTAWIMLIR